MKIFLENLEDDYLKPWALTEEDLIELIYNDLLEVPANKAVLAAVDNDFSSGAELQRNEFDIKQAIQSELLPILYRETEKDPSLDPRDYETVFSKNPEFRAFSQQFQHKYKHYLDDQMIIWSESVKDL